RHAERQPRLPRRTGQRQRRSRGRALARRRTRDQRRAHAVADDARPLRGAGGETPRRAGHRGAGGVARQRADAGRFCERRVQRGRGASSHRTGADGGVAVTREQLPYLGASDGAAVGHGVHGRAMRGPAPPEATKAPFPWFGGKSRAAPLIWDRFGEVVNYVEPFAGSLAVLLSRPSAPQIETVNDLDCYLANFWRCLSALSTGCDYEGRTGDEVASEVASFADWPVNEADLHARRRWLVEQSGFRERMRRDP